MQRFLKYLLILLLLAGVLPFMIKGKDGQPLMKTDYFSAPDILLPGLSVVEEKADAMIHSARVTLSSGAKQLKREGTGKVYKWRDGNGQWVFSDQPNPGGVSQEVAVNPQLSTLPAPHRTTAERSDAEVHPEPGLKSGLPSLTSVPLTDVPKLVEDSKALKETLEARNQNLQQ